MINKILVVDDMLTDRIYLRNILLEAGFEVLTACSGREALETARLQQPDLVFLDIVMDDMDGYQACRKLTTAEETRHIPVIMVSANTQRVDRVWAQRQGARAYVGKPYTADDITAQIRKFQ